MRFERLHEGERIVAKILNRPVSEMIMYGARAGGYKFVISYDGMHGEWSASYKTLSQRKSATFIVPGWETHPKFKTQHEAETACRAAWKILRAKVQGPVQ